MDCHTLSSSLQGDGCENISMNDQFRRLKHLSSNSESFIVDMDRFSHPTTAKDETTTPNSRITRNVSRKGSQKKNSNTENEAINTQILSPTAGASLLGTTISTPEKVALVAVGSTINSQLHHHQITVSTTITTPTAQPKLAASKFNSFKRSSPGRPIIDPRGILLIFATLSSMGTILLIYFTLCMARLSGDETAAIS